LINHSSTIRKRLRTKTPVREVGNCGTHPDMPQPIAFLPLNLGDEELSTTEKAKIEHLS